VSDEVEIETKDLQETIEEIHRERADRAKEESQTRWTGLIALTTAILAAFGAIAALESGSLANEGMMHQLQASDTWNEFQASREKIHLYGIASASLLDAKVIPSGGKPAKQPDINPETPGKRLSGYLDELNRESGKTKSLGKTASGLEKRAEEELRHHHEFAYSVALLQVAIALGAVSALTKIKSIWLISMALGVAGIVLFGMGFTR